MGVRIEADGLVMRYGSVTAVDGISFTVEPGEFFGLLGPNGAGKTTTLEMVEGLRKPQAGTVTIDGQAPWRRDPALQRRMGVQLQSSSFFERLTAREQLVTFGALYGVPKERSDALLEQVGLADKADERTEDLSGGQKQRLSIACALVHEPDVVFLDEPTAALGVRQTANVLETIRKVRDEGVAVVFISHSMPHVIEVSDRVQVLRMGRRVATFQTADTSMEELVSAMTGATGNAA